MSTIPTSLTKEQFEEHIRPHLSTAKRGYECSIPLYKVFNYILYKLYTCCPWKALPIDPDPEHPEKKELGYGAIYHHFRKWRDDDSLENVWKGSILTIKDDLDLSEVNADGTHTIAKKGGESVAYQGRKKAKTSNIIAVTDAQGFVIGTTDLIAGNHNDAYQLKDNLQTLFKQMKQLGLSLVGTYFNGDKGFDTREARKTCFNHGLIPNIAENKRNRKRPKRGRKRLFNEKVYKRRFVCERTFAWADKFKSLVFRFDHLDKSFLAANHIAFAMINLRHVLAT